MATGDFWDVSASDIAGAVTSYYVAKAAAKSTGDARLTTNADGTSIDGRTAPGAGASVAPSWLMPALLIGGAALAVYALAR